MKPAEQGNISQLSGHQEEELISKDGTSQGTRKSPAREHPVASDGRSIESKQVVLPATPIANRTQTFAEFATLAAGLREKRFEARILEPGSRVDRYKILQQIGRGGFSAVYLAEHVHLRHKVALKTLHRADETDEGPARFLREARVLALLHNSHVVRVFDADIRDGLPYIILEYLEGETLQQRLKGAGCLTVQHSMNLLEELGEVLCEQEKLGILHRDIKPSNITVRPDGGFCLFDYGLVGFNERVASGVLNDPFFEYITRDGKHWEGTPQYMASEQHLGKADHRSDLFGLGITAWECLTGRRARTSISVDNLAEELGRPVPPLISVQPNVPSELDRIISSLTAVSPDNRYASAAEFVGDLQNYRYAGRAPHGALIGAVFIAMPFSRRFGQIYSALEEACLRARLRPVRTDRVVFSNNIWNEIVKNIVTAKVIVADFTPARWNGHPNPNVVTEAAHARALNRPLIILSQGTPEQLPFDWRQMPVIPYRANREGMAKLTATMENHLRVLTSLRAEESPGHGPKP